LINYYARESRAVSNEANSSNINLGSGAVPSFLASNAPLSEPKKPITDGLMCVPTFFPKQKAQ